MERREHFGRRAAPQREIPRPRPAVANVEGPAPGEILRPAAEHLDLYAGDAEIDREIEEWKAARKRSLREPWRSFAIAAGIAFGVGNLILPPAVANIMDYVTTGLFVTSIVAGLRQKPG